MTIPHQTLTVENPDAFIGFEQASFRDTELVRSLGFTSDLDRELRGDVYLTIHGTRVISMGYPCPSCTTIFSRVDPTELPMSPYLLSSMLHEGITELDEGILNAVRIVLPTGQYIAAVLNSVPRLVSPKTSDDYFANEYRDSTDREHNPSQDYYRSRSFRFEPADVPDARQQALHELIVPLYPPTKCDYLTVNHYRGSMRAGLRPTALAISVLDFVALTYWEDERFNPDPQEQWVLTHYLLDGHHKMLAAAHEGREVGILSFLSLEQGCGHLGAENLYRILDQ